MIRKFVNYLIFKYKNKTCKVGKRVTISRKTKVGYNCQIGNYCTLSKDVILGNGVSIGDYSNMNKISIGNNSMIESGVKIVGPGKGKILIGKECYIGINNILDTSDNITIGDFVHIAGPSTGLWAHSSANMCMNSVSLNDKERDKFRPTAPIMIEDNVYIGGNCTIYPGVNIHNHSIIAPNSAVTKDVKPYTMIGGVPAKVIKKIINQ
jgi:acetyltransferase-like isoleucine patch superfamily enzyme